MTIIQILDIKESSLGVDFGHLIFELENYYNKCTELQETFYHITVGTHF